MALCRVTTSQHEAAPPARLFALVMGSTYEQLHPSVRAFHDLHGTHVLHGLVETESADNLTGRILSRMLGTPHRSIQGAIRFVLDAQGTEQTWTREFPGRTMRSKMRLLGGMIVERLGPAELTFSLVADRGCLEMKLESLRAFGLPCPRWLMPRITAREHGEDGRLHFHIRATLPFVGRVTGYRGHLELPILSPALI